MGDTGLPASLTLEGRLGEDGFSSVTAGFNLYFGGEDKSLIRRHREDDPRLRFFDMFNAGVLGADGVLSEEDDAPMARGMLDVFYCEGLPWNNSRSISAQR